MKKKYLVIGDSITSGIGSKSHNYVDILNATQNDIEFVNKGKSGATCKYFLDCRSFLNEDSYDGCLIFIGNVDAKFYPNIHSDSKYLKKVPKRYLVGEFGQLDIRAYYSKNIFKRIKQKIGNAIRCYYRKKIAKKAGLFQPVKITEFEEEYYSFLQFLTEKHFENVYCISTVYLDGSLYWGSDQQYREYNKSIQRLSSKFGYHFINVFDVLKHKAEEKTTHLLKMNESMNGFYFLDRFHPNEEGLSLISQMILKEVKKTHEH